LNDEYSTADSAPMEGPQGDGELIRLLTRHKSQLFGFIFCMVHNLPDAEDVFQQAAITMWEKFDQFKVGSDFVAWACSIARFKALNLLNARGRERACFSEHLIDELASREASRPEFQEVRLQALAACREKLSPTDQSLLSLCYGESGTFREIAERIGRPVGSVYDSLCRIRRDLYTCIQRKLANEGYL